MSENIMVRVSIFASAAILAALVSCGGPTEPSTADEIDQRFDDPTTTYVTETVDYTDVPYDFTGPTSIADMLAIVDPNDFVSYLVDRDYPVSGACDSRGNTVETTTELPVEIEGIVTLHPRYFIKTSFCGEDERYYGSYFIQDSTGGILVLKDSRVADFQMGDRVRINVRGLQKYFDTTAVLIHDPAQIVSVDQPIHYEEVDRELTNDDVGKTLRFTGKVNGLPTNTNFNEMCLVREEDTSDEECGKPCRVAFGTEDCETQVCVPDFNGAATGRCSRDMGYWLVSLDREIGQRQPVILEKGDVVTVTGPIINSFGIKFLTMRWGQFQIQE